MNTEHTVIVVHTEELDELRKKEKEMGYTPDWELDAFMKAEIRKGKKDSIVTDLVIKLLGLDVSVASAPSWLHCCRHIHTEHAHLRTCMYRQSLASAHMCRQTVVLARMCSQTRPV